MSWREYHFLLTPAAKKITPPPLSSPLKLTTKFCGSKTLLLFSRSFKVLLRIRTRLVFCLFCFLLRKTRKNARKAALFSGFLFPA